MSRHEEIAAVFAFFNEIGIISQLSGRLLERSLPKGFVGSQFFVLNHLVRVGEGRTPLAIARSFQVPKTTMTHTLAGLEKAGLIRFAPNPQDGRSKCVFLTPEGRDFRNGAIARLAPEVGKLTQALDIARLAELTPELARIRQYLDQERDTHNGTSVSENDRG